MVSLLWNRRTFLYAMLFNDRLTQLLGSIYMPQPFPHFVERVSKILLELKYLCYIEMRVLLLHYMLMPDAIATENVGLNVYTCHTKVCFHHL